jgi:DNA polymerase-1
VPIALIDADIVAFRAATAQRPAEVDWDGEVLIDPEDHVEDDRWRYYYATDMVRDWATRAGCDQWLLCFTGKGNFRKAILPTYKANRAGAPKPPALSEIRGHLMFSTAHRVVDGLEADDVMGILATREKYRDAVIVTIDKDLRGVPGRHFNPMKDEGVVTVTETEANHTWLMQVLTGDSTDGYTGIPGVGPKKAAAILFLGGPRGNAEYLWGSVVAAYLKAGLTEQDALQQARVARILRDDDWDGAARTVLLWHPTTRQPLALNPMETA